VNAAFALVFKLNWIHNNHTRGQIISPTPVSYGSRFLPFLNWLKGDRFPGLDKSRQRRSKFFNRFGSAAELPVTLDKDSGKTSSWWFEFWSVMFRRRLLISRFSITWSARVVRILEEFAQTAGEIIHESKVAGIKYLCHLNLNTQLRVCSERFLALTSE